MAIIAASCGAVSAFAAENIIWDDRPATLDRAGTTVGDRVSGGYKSRSWERSWYPLGNGRLGCMVDGGTRTLCVQFNVDSLWTGDENISSATSDSEANANYAKMGAYQNFGELAIALTCLPEGEVKDYRRQLDLSTAVYSDRFKVGGVAVRRRIFASAPDDAIFLETLLDPGDAPVAIDMNVSLMGAHGEPESKSSLNGKPVQFYGRLANGLEYAACADFVATGSKFQSIIALRAITGGKAIALPVRREQFDKLLARHVKDYKKYYARSARSRTKGREGSCAYRAPVQLRTLPPHLLLAAWDAPREPAGAVEQLEQPCLALRLPH